MKSYWWDPDRTGLLPYKNRKKSPPSLSLTCENTSRKSHQQLSPETKWANTLILDSPTSRTVRNKFFLLKPNSLGPYISLPEQTNTPAPTQPTPLFWHHLERIYSVPILQACFVPLFLTRDSDRAKWQARGVFPRNEFVNSSSLN